MTFSREEKTWRITLQNARGYWRKPRDGSKSWKKDGRRERRVRRERLS